MTNGRGKNKARNKRRPHVVSQGVNGGGGEVSLTEVQKALLGGGAVDRIKHVEMGHARDWSGASPIVRHPWDAEQAERNKDAGLCGDEGRGPRKPSPKA